MQVMALRRNAGGYGNPALAGDSVPVKVSSPARARPNAIPHVNKHNEKENDEQTGFLHVESLHARSASNNAIATLTSQANEPPVANNSTNPVLNHVLIAIHGMWSGARSVWRASRLFRLVLCVASLWFIFAVTIMTSPQRASYGGLYELQQSKHSQLFRANVEGFRASPAEIRTSGPANKVPNDAAQDNGIDQPHLNARLVQQLASAWGLAQDDTQSRNRDAAKHEAAHTLIAADNDTIRVVKELHQTASSRRPLELDLVRSRLGQVELASEFSIREAFRSDLRSTTTVQLGSFRMRHPRFIRTSHVLWWHRYEVMKMRKVFHCADADHPAVLNLTVPLSKLQEYKSDLNFDKQAVQQSYAGRDPIPTHDGWFTYCEVTMTEGEVSVLLNATVAHTETFKDHMCSQKDSVDVLLDRAQEYLDKPGNTKTLPVVDSLFWAVLPASAFVQHWVQNVLPKLAQSSIVEPTLYDYNVSQPLWTANQEILPDRFPIIQAFYSYMGWNAPVEELNTPVFARKLVYACTTPPLHPALWQHAQKKFLRVVEKPIQERKKIVYCGRTKTGRMENPGRRVLNEESLVGMLGNWAQPMDGGVAPYEIVEFDHTKYSTIAELVEFWSDARALIGPHGGCLTNVVFIPPNALVVELFPLVFGQRAPLRHAGYMFWAQSMFLEHDYWMLPSSASHMSGDFSAPLAELCDILEIALGAPGGHSCASLSLPRS